MKPEEVVQRQFDAYNARNLELFAAQYSDDIRVYRPPAAEPTLVGKEAFKEFYATKRFVHTTLHAELVNRIVVGNKVIDHERITGTDQQPFEVAVVYEVVDGVIQRTWYYAAE